MVFLYLPFIYTFHTRLLSLSSKFAWFTTYIIPVLIACYYFKLDYTSSFLIISSIYAAYEIGYIFNDCELTKKEENPTLRLSVKELEYYESKKKYIFCLRFLILIILLFISFFFHFDVFYSLLTVVVLILLTYFIYNNIRNDFNLPLYSLLVYCRYFLIFAIMAKSFILTFFLFLVYPFCVTLEFSTKKRFRSSHFIKFKNFDRFRSLYYSLLLAIAIFIYFCFNVAYADLFLYLSFYFCFYRLLSYIFLSKLIRSE